MKCWPTMPVPPRMPTSIGFICLAQVSRTSCRYKPIASISSALGIRSSLVWATWMLPGPIRKGSPHASSKRRNIGRERHYRGWKSVQRAQMHSRNHQNLFRLRIRPYSSLNISSKFRYISNNTDHDFGTGFVGDHIRRAPASDGSYVKRAGAKKFIGWQLDRAECVRAHQEAFRWPTRQVPDRPNEPCARAPRSHIAARLSTQAPACSR